MRNFPHQINDIAKIVGALRVAADILDSGRDLRDDGVFGYALAGAGIYAFRGLANPSPEQLEAKITEERTKDPGDQGARTFARDIRRTLSLLGFLEPRGEDAQVSPTGTRILALPELPQGEGRILWIDAILGIALGDPDEGERSHPARAMLRMVEAIPGIEKRWLAFALDMDDDSDGELAARGASLDSCEESCAIHRDES